MKANTQRVVFVTALAAALTVPSLVRGQDTTPPARPDIVPFGVMGAVRGEIVRLNIVNVAQTPTDPSLPPDPYCRGTIAFVDGNGDPLRRADGSAISRSVELRIGQSAWVQFHAGAMLGRDELRVAFRPVVVTAPPDPYVPPDPFVPPDPYNPCVPSVEIIDAATGQTRLVTGGMVRAGGPAPAMASTPR